MKSEYLKRELTINRKSFNRLSEDCTLESASNCCDIEVGCLMSWCGAKLFGQVGDLLFADTPAAQTFNGREVFMAILRSAEKLIRSATEDYEQYIIAGFSMILMLDFMHRAFGSDKDEEENTNA